MSHNTNSTTKKTQQIWCLFFVGISVGDKIARQKQPAKAKAKAKAKTKRSEAKRNQTSPPLSCETTTAMKKGLPPTPLFGSMHAQDTRSCNNVNDKRYQYWMYVMSSQTVRRIKMPSPCKARSNRTTANSNGEMSQCMPNNGDESMPNAKCQIKCQTPNANAKLLALQCNDGWWWWCKWLTNALGKKERKWESGQIKNVSRFSILDLQSSDQFRGRIDEYNNQEMG